MHDITNMATKNALNKKSTEIENKTTATAGFITTKLNRLTKVGFDARSKEPASSVKQIMFLI